MKAYEFYVLLGKYKRKTISPSEYERFRSEVATVRNYRTAFYESTGESYPVFPTRSMRAGVHLREKKKVDTLESTNSGLEAAAEPDLHHLEQTAHHGAPLFSAARETKGNVVHLRRRKRSKRLKWFPLVRNIASNHPLVCFLCCVIIAGLGIFLALRPVSTPTNAIILSPPAPIITPTAKSIPANEVPTLAAGRMLSEADRLIAVDPKAFQIAIEPMEPMRAPVIGIEQAILEGLEARFPEPNLDTNTPKIPSN
jgi:hypothetical protein